MVSGSDILIDIENVILDDVYVYIDLMNVNIVELIMGFDDVMVGFFKDFDEMWLKIMGEMLIGFFFKVKVDSMCQECMCIVNIDDKLQDLILKFNVIL